MQPLVLIVSKERTASQAIYATLREEMHSGVIHSHYLDASHLGDEAMRMEARKLAKLDYVAYEVERAKKRTFITIIRDLTDRMISCLWYIRHAELTAWREQHGSFAGAEAIIANKLRTTLIRDAAYQAQVYSRIGLPENPAPGHYRNGGDDTYVLDFANLAEDFATTAEALTGRRLEVRAKNSGEHVGGELYPEFRAWAEPIIADMIQRRHAA